METEWSRIRREFGAAFSSSLHFAIATVAPDGAPHVAPIGSVLLQEPGRGVYFEEFPQRMPEHLRENAKICVLAVNSSRWFWVGALLRGRFERPPALRLYGTAGVRRRASEREVARWQRRVRALRFTKGHRQMWSGMQTVRELQFTGFDFVRLGKMTEGLKS